MPLIVMKLYFFRKCVREGHMTSLVFAVLSLGF